MNKLQRTFDTPTDVYIIGEYIESDEHCFLVTDDYHSTEIIFEGEIPDKIHKNRQRTIFWHDGAFHIYTKQELLDNLQFLGEDYVSEYCQDGVILPNFTGTIKIALLDNETGKDITAPDDEILLDEPLLRQYNDDYLMKRKGEDVMDVYIVLPKGTIVTERMQFSEIVKLVGGEKITPTYIIPEKKILYLDMDGVIADFERTIKVYYPDVDNESIPYEERSEMVDEVCEKIPNIFQIIPPIKGAIEAVEELFDLYEVYFLSTPMWNVPSSFTDKRLWLEYFFGDLAKKRLILSHRKDLNIGHFLVDDRLKNGAGEFKGEHIHFGTEKFKDWGVTMPYLRSKA